MYRRTKKGFSNIRISKIEIAHKMCWYSFIFSVSNYHQPFLEVPSTYYYKNNESYNKKTYELSNKISEVFRPLFPIRIFDTVFQLLSIFLSRRVVTLIVL